MESTGVLQNCLLELANSREPHLGENFGKAVRGTLQLDQVPPIAILLIRVAPQSGLKLNPFEIVYGKSKFLF